MRALRLGSATIHSMLGRLRSEGGAFLLLRYAAAGLGAVRGLVLAELLGVALFGKVALVLQAAMLLETASLGGPSGYVYRYYNLPDAREGDPGGFVRACGLWLLLAGLAALVLSPLTDVLFWAGLLFLINVRYLALEPVLRVRGRFAVIVLPQLVLPVATLGAIGLLFAVADPVDENAVFACLVAAQAAAVATFVIAARLPLTPRRESLAALLARYRDNVRAGFPIFFGGMLYLFLMFVDRLFIAAFYEPAALGVYGLAIQLVGMALVGLQACSYIATVRIGASLRNGPELRRVLVRVWLAAAGIAAATLTGAAGVAWALEATVYSEYHGLFATVLVACVGVTAYNAVSTAAALVYYRRAQRPLHVALAAALAASIGGDAALARAGVHWLWLPAFGSALLTLLAALCGWLVLRELSRGADPPD